MWKCQSNRKNQIYLFFSDIEKCPLNGSQQDNQTNHLFFPSGILKFLQIPQPNLHDHTTMSFLHLQSQNEFLIMSPMCFGFIHSSTNRRTPVRKLLCIFGTKRFLAFVGPFFVLIIMMASNLFFNNLINWAFYVKSCS